jgi:hypothetical protein
VLLRCFDDGLDKRVVCCVVVSFRLTRSRTLGLRTDVGSQVLGGEHLDRQIGVDLANDLRAIAVDEMGVLRIGRQYPVASNRDIAALTRSRLTVTLPSASRTAISPRSWVTLPTMMTFRPTCESRYGDETRGVETDSDILGVGVGRRRVCSSVLVEAAG